MAPPIASRVSRRFAACSEERAPCGLVVLSLVGHLVVGLMAIALVTPLGPRSDDSRTYVVNLQRTAPWAGSRTLPRAEPKLAERSVRPPPTPVAAAPATPEGEGDRSSSAAVTAPRTGDVGYRPSPELPLPPAPRPPPRPPEVPRAQVTQPPPEPAAPPAAPAAPVASARGDVEPTRFGEALRAPNPGGLGLEVSDFPFTYYLRQVQAKISERWAPPREAAPGGARATIRFEIGRDGTITAPALERSSGNTLYDQAALRAVVEATPLPPLPAEFKAASLRVHLGFEAQPEQG